VNDHATPARWLAAMLPIVVMLAAVPGVADVTDEHLQPHARITHVVPSPDGEQVAYVAATADPTANTVRSELFVASANGAGARGFTSGDAHVEAPGWSPDGRWLAYLQHADGQPMQLMMMPSDGGGAQRLSQPGSSVEAFQWSPAGDAVAYLQAEAGGLEQPPPLPQARAIVVDELPPPRRLWWLKLDAEGTPFAAQPLTPAAMQVGNELLGEAFDWSPDGREIAFTHTRTAALDDWKSADVSVVDTATGHLRPFQQSKAAEFAPSYSPDGRHIAFNITVFPPSWVRQWRVGLARADGSRLKLLAATADEQPGIVGWISNRLLLVAEPHRTVTALWKLPIDGGAPRRFDAGAAVLSAVTLNEPGTRLAFATMDPQTPQQAAITSLRRFRPVTVAGSHAEPAAAPAPTRLMTWTSADGHDIEGLLTLPPAADPATRLPLLLLIHDEPAGVFTRDFPGHPGGVYPLATLASLGYAILRVNPRGSSGYGYPFRAASRGDWGGADYHDLMSGVDHVIAGGIADPGRLAVLGWGHGAFLAARVVVRSHRFGAAVLGAPMTDLMQMRTTSDTGALVADYLEGEFWDDHYDVYRAHSPLLEAHRITTPVLILHGSADRHVLPAQSLALHRALQAQGLDTRMVLYPSAPHHLIEPAQRLHAAGEIVAWLKRHVPHQPGPDQGRLTGR
jgi:dipeptidyl aminopeptidase/acylaminoacyl peptidase